MWASVEREIIGVEWRQAGEQTVLIYDEGEPEHLTASEAMAAQLAEEVGLDVVVKSPDSIRWARPGRRGPDPSIGNYRNPSIRN